MSEPENVSLELIGKILKDVATDVRELKSGQKEIKDTLSRQGQNLEELNAAVAALTVSTRHIRADAAQLLAESGDLARRVKRLEEHLGLPPIN